MKIVRYTIVRHWNEQQVEAEVQKLIKAGMQPFGPPAVTVNGATLAIIQAMVQYEE